MRKPLDKKILKPYIDFLLQRIKFLYGYDTTLLEERINNLTGLYVSDELTSKDVMEFDPIEKCINIQDSYIRRYEDGSLVLEFDQVGDMFKHSLIHELLHAASSREDAEGIMPHMGGRRRYLNEGITQMIADEVCGYYENKFLMSYNFQKLIANIFRVCFGNDGVIGSYFFDPNAISNNIKDHEVFNQFEELLYVSLYYYTGSKGKERERREDNILKLVVLNVIREAYNRVKPEKREEFLSKLILSVSGDEVIKAKLIDYIHQYLNVNVTEALAESNIELSNFVFIQTQRNSMDKIDDMTQFSILDNGMIYILGGKGAKIENKEDQEKIYLKLFELNGYNKNITPENIDKYVEMVKKGQFITIHEDSILKRRIIFCGLKNLLLQKGIFLVNDFKEFDKHKSVKPKYINTALTFEDYKKLCEYFSICKTKVGKNEFTYSIVYNSTKDEVEDVDIRSAAFYALNWLYSVQSMGLDGIEAAYNEKNKAAFDYIRNELILHFKADDDFNVGKIAKNSKFPEIIALLCDNPVKMEWVFSHIFYIARPTFAKAKKGVSTEEIKNPYYLANRSEEEARDIISKFR